VPIATSPEQLALQASIREWAKRAGTLALVRRLEPGADVRPLLAQLLEEVVARHGDPAEQETAELCRWLDIQAKRNVVLTFGGGVNEIQRELIATAGLGQPRVPR
jgi:hypothetical protein